MEVASDARPLGYALFETHLELRLQLPHPQFVYSPDHPQKRRNACPTEPVRLVPSRRNHEIERRTFFVQQAAVVARDHAEAVMLRRQLRVLHLAIVDDLSPILVLAFQLVAEAHLLRRYKAQRG